MPLVIGTAGHIDHGKTTLVKRLTNTDCDRLQEEKERGITIELGFAHLPLPQGGRLSIVDVPGHERFIHTMVSGASGIDFALLVIAADESVMPQTREHLEICTLLGITQGAVVLTKKDLVDDELLELAKDEVHHFLQGSFLENAPFFPLSAQSGDGLDALKSYLHTLPHLIQPQRRSDLFRLPIDRVFTMKGHGTVVTGTLISGTAKTGDDALILPQALQTKIRHVQNHGLSTDEAFAGQRTAINLQGLAVSDIHRGDMLTHPKTLFPNTRLLLQLNCLASSPRPLRQRTTVHFHHGAKTVQAQIYFPEQELLEPGQSAICEIRLQEPLSGVFGDRCVIRSFSPLRTVAGGLIIHPRSVYLRRKTERFSANCQQLHCLAASVRPNLSTSEQLQTAAALELHEQPATIQVLAALELCAESGASLAELSIMSSEGGKALEKRLASLGTKQEAFCFDKEERLFLGKSSMESLSQDCLAAVTSHHKNNPMKQGPNRHELVSGWGKKLKPKLAYFVIERLIKQHKLSLTQDSVHLPAHKISLGSEQVNLRGALLAAHNKAGLAPPNMQEVLKELNVSAKEIAPLLKHMQEKAELVKVCEGIWYAPQILQDIQDKILLWFQTHENLDLAGLKEMTGLSRKYLVCLLEYFDKERLTMRVGDTRILRKQSGKTSS